MNRWRKQTHRNIEVIRTLIFRKNHPLVVRKPSTTKLQGVDGLVEVPFTRCDPDGFVDLAADGQQVAAMIGSAQGVLYDFDRVDGTG